MKLKLSKKLSIIFEVFLQSETGLPSTPPAMKFWTPDTTISPSQFLFLGSCIMNRYARSTCQATTNRFFRSFFGVSPLVCTMLWNRIKHNVPHYGSPNHLLWSLFFLKTYTPELVASLIFNTDPKKYRKWIWIIVKLLSNINKIDFNARLDERDVVTGCKISVDGVDMKICEPYPFLTEWYSHKFSGPGVRYEIGVSIYSWKILWLHGPFPCGTHPDQKIFNLSLARLLENHEKVIADKAYGGSKVVIYPHLPDNEQNLHKRIRARHESLNMRLKLFKVLSNCYRHQLFLHKFCTFAVANIVQVSLDYDFGLFEL